MRNRISAVVSTASAALSKWVYPSVSPSSRLSPSVSPSSRLSPSVFPSSPFFSSVTKGTKDLRDVADEFSRSFWLKKDQLQACSIKLGTFKDPRDTLKKDQLQALSIKLGTFKDPRDRNRMARRMARLKKRQFYARWIKLGTFKDTRGAQRHPLRSYEWSYMEYVLSLVRRMDALPEQERFELGYRNSPLQPLMNNLEAQRYQTFKRETVKYMQVLMVVGAGRGPLVRASLQAAEETGCKLKVYAVEKNPNAVVRLHRLVKLESWEGIVTIISCDMRYWDAPEKADIMVSELLGSFGDNGLSPECLDGAQRFLKPDGISIPSSYTSFLQPVRTAKLYNDVMSRKETAYVGKLYNVARLAPSQPVFTFHHPDYSTKKSNQRYKKLVFEIPSDTESGCVHGFAGYFDSVLYKDVHLGTEPSTATPNMFSWFAIFFPLRTPVCIKPGSALEVHFWRCCDSSKVWYEWCVTSPSPKPLWMYL